MTNAQDRWTACPQGELSRLRGRLRGRRRRRITAQAAGVLAVLLTGTVLWTMNLRNRDNTFAGLTCTQVSQLATAYGEGKLDADIHEQVRLHVNECPRCHDRFRNMGLISQLVAEPLIPPSQVAIQHHHEPPDGGTRTRFL